MRPRLTDLSDDDLLRLREASSEALHRPGAEQPERRYGIHDRSTLEVEIGEIDQELKRRGLRRP